ncbi:hypothetical protein C8F04DRAFT_1275143 [Mycena alexandri]|uniref:Uncharacterized protein n=1 Tax=Mycena alexandri TaxID=1745969 RepID=A0AAD6S755_9AGAR|nr:hypothetical protein C8F04DRAFT_1275143 [Mycena alexandri]
MPKAAKSPSKARPKPRPIKSPKKKVSSSHFVNDEADESDDGVLVELPARDMPGSPQQDVAPPNGTMSDEEYDRDFINDGDPFEDADSVHYPSVSPPASPHKGKVHKSTARQNTPSQWESFASPPYSGSPRAEGSPQDPEPEKEVETSVQHSPSFLRSGEIIELPDTSDEDLAAMDVDDSMFKKPTGVKASALPPSLVTRSAAAKRGADSGSSAPSFGAFKRPKVEDFDEVVTVSTPPPEAPAFVNGVMNPAMVNFINNLLAQQSTISSAPSGSSSSTAKSSRRVDHDQIALDAAISSSLQSPVSLKDKPKRAKPRYSPDWDPPDLNDILEDIKKDTGSSSAAGAKTKSVASSDPASDAPVTRSKGKGKARQSSPIPPLESVTSDEEPAPPVKKKAAAVSSRSRRTESSAVKAEEDMSPDPEPQPDSSLGSFLVHRGYPVVPTTGLSNDKTALTMAQFQRAARGDSTIPEDVQDTDHASGSGEDVDTVFLEDIEVYRVYFNPKAKCGVFDLRLQAPSLRPTYIGLHPLPGNRRILPSYDCNRNSLEEVDTSTGGRINWESWYNQNPRMLAANSIGAIVFEEAKPNFVNPSRVSPLRLNTRISAGSSSTYRLHVDDRVAICVTVICTTESHLVAPKRIGVRSERMRKWVSGVPHDQEWERMEAGTCLQFHEQTMYSQITDKALSFQTMISPDPRNATSDPSATEQRNTRSIPSAMFSSPSPNKRSFASSSSRPSASSSSRTLLAYNDPVPVYDARRIVVDFDKDLARLDEILPLFPGEIPVGSYTVVGYTMSSYMATLSGTSERLPHVGCNILWAIFFPSRNALMFSIQLNILSSCSLRTSGVVLDSPDLPAFIVDKAHSTSAKSAL